MRITKTVLYRMVENLNNNYGISPGLYLDKHVAGYMLMNSEGRGLSDRLEAAEMGQFLAGMTTAYRLIGR